MTRHELARAKAELRRNVYTDPQRAVEAMDQITDYYRTIDAMPVDVAAVHHQLADVVQRGNPTGET